MKNQNKITKDTTLSEILKYPEAKEILAEYELPCLYCPMAKFEMEDLRLNEIAERYNIDIKGLLKGLNRALKR